MRTSPFYLAALLLAAIATIADARQRRIPNWLTLAPLLLAPLGWAFRARANAGAFSVPGPLLFAGLSLVGGVVCAAVPFALFRYSMIGGGDVKLLACVGALTLPGSGLFIEWLSLIFAALTIPAILTYRGRLSATVAGTFAWVTHAMGPHGRRRPPPPELRERHCFSPYVLAATIVAAMIEGAS